MDPHEIWQENKRWIVGVAVGLVLFWIGSTVVGSIYDTTVHERRMRADAGGIPRDEELFDGAALDLLRQEADALVAQEQELRAALEYRVGDEFRLEGKGAPDLHYDKVRRDVRRRLMEEVDQANVEIDRRNVQWPTNPAGVAEFQAALIGLCVADDAMARLLRASRRARERAPDAIGLQAVEQLRVESGRESPANRRRRSRSGSGADELIEEYKVSFRVRADAETVYGFLESCRDPQRPLSLEALKIKGGKPGEPLSVQGTLVAIHVEDLPQ